MSSFVYLQTATSLRPTSIHSFTAMVMTQVSMVSTARQPAGAKTTITYERQPVLSLLLRLYCDQYLYFHHPLMLPTYGCFPTVNFWEFLQKDLCGKNAMFAP